MGGSAQIDCTDCPKGQYCMSGFVVAVDCGLGKYQGMVGQSQCVVCPTGQYCPLTITITPVNCAAGSLRATTGATLQADCAVCPQGQYCVAGVSQGTSCGTGSYQSATGQSQCLVCPAGKYCPSATTVTPLDCAVGTFRGSTGGINANDCTDCSCG
jgi:hypothetical protein